MSRRLTFRIGGALAVVGLLALGEGRATANIIPNFEGISGPVAGAFTYSYHADVTADQQAATGDFLTLYDVIGLVPASITIVESGWTSTVQNVGITPFGIAPTDDPTAPNITISRTGAAIPGPSLAAVHFSFRSTSGVTGVMQFAAQGHRVGLPPDPVNEISNIGRVTGPVASTTPEPASLALLAMGVPFALSLVRRRQNKASGA